MKRYIIHYDARGEEEHPNGDFVYWPDVQKLLQDYEDLQKSYNELKLASLRFAASVLS